MKFTTRIIFGKTEVEKHLSNMPLTEVEGKINSKEYSFTTKEEMKSFQQGVCEGVGWSECYVVESS